MHILAIFRYKVNIKLMTKLEQNTGAVENAKDSIITQAKALTEMSKRLGSEFDHAVSLIINCQGRVVLCGMGKSGLVAKKIAATFASTGTTSFFMHPAEALHGDLGMLTSNDVLILISYSGETEEIVRLLPSLKDSQNSIIAMVGEVSSTLANNADVSLNIKVEREVCPNNLAPTTSTLTTMAMGDALAVSLMKLRNFKASDFARFHPAGNLGRRLLTTVAQVMYRQNLPTIMPQETLQNAILSMTEGRLGLVVIVNDAGKVCGVFTDGDLRRTIMNNADVSCLKVEDVMSLHPLSITETAKIYEAEQLMLERKVKALLVLDDEQRLKGIVDIFEQT